MKEADNTLTEVSVLEKAAKLCVNNAKQYLKDADMLLSFNSYGHALALSVLSDVELGRAVMYSLWSKGLITEEILPSAYQQYFRERQYGLLASETWWIGLVLASNIEEVIQTILDASEEAGDMAAAGGELSAAAKRRITGLVGFMELEKTRLKMLEEYREKGFFVDFSLNKASVNTPSMVRRELVKERLRKGKKRIKVGEPFLALSLSEVPKRISQVLLQQAFQSILPQRDRISQFILPTITQVEKAP